MQLRIGAVALTAMFTLAGVVSTAAQPDGMSVTDRRNAYSMLEGVRKTIESDYFDPTFKGHDLSALATVARERIGNAGSVAEALAAIAQFELELDDLHTTFMRPWLTVSVDYGWTMGMAGNNCYVIDVDPQSDAARQDVAVGDQLNLSIVSSRRAPTCGDSTTCSMTCTRCPDCTRDSSLPLARHTRWIWLQRCIRNVPSWTCQTSPEASI